MQKTIKREPSFVKTLKVIEFNIEGNINRTGDFEDLFNQGMNFCMMLTKLTYSPKKPVSKIFILRENINEFKKFISGNIEEYFDENYRDCESIKEIASQLQNINTYDIDMININIQWV